MLWTNAELAQTVLQFDMDGVDVVQSPLSFLVEKWRPCNEAEQGREPREKFVAVLSREY